MSTTQQEILLKLGQGWTARNMEGLDSKGDKTVDRWIFEFRTDPWSYHVIVADVDIILMIKRDLEPKELPGFGKVRVSEQIYSRKQSRHDDIVTDIVRLLSETLHTLGEVSGTLAWIKKEVSS